MRYFCLSRGLGDVYKRGVFVCVYVCVCVFVLCVCVCVCGWGCALDMNSLLYTHVAAEEEESVYFGARGGFKKKKKHNDYRLSIIHISRSHRNMTYLSRAHP